MSISYRFSMIITWPTKNRRSFFAHTAIINPAKTFEKKAKILCRHILIKSCSQWHQPAAHSLYIRRVLFKGLMKHLSGHNGWQQKGQKNGKLCLAVQELRRGKSIKYEKRQLILKFLIQSWAAEKASSDAVSLLCVLEKRPHSTAGLNERKVAEFFVLHFIMEKGRDSISKWSIIDSIYWNMKSFRVSDLIQNSIHASRIVADKAQGLCVGSHFLWKMAWNIQRGNV